MIAPIISNMVSGIKKEFYPLDNFKHANVGNAITQLNSYLYNKENSRLLEAPILNWTILCLLSSIVLLLFKQYELENQHEIITATIAIILTISMIQSILFIISYTYLNHVRLIKTAS